MYAISPTFAPCGEDLGQVTGLVLYPEEERGKFQLFGASGDALAGLAGDDRGGDPGVPEALDAHPVADREALQLLAPLRVVDPGIGEDASTSVKTTRITAARRRSSFAGRRVDLFGDSRRVGCGHHHAVQPPSTTRFEPVT